MSLLSRLTLQIPPRIRDRGRQYLRDGRVRIASGTDESVDAVVQGTRPYDVSLRRSGSTLQAGCTCPYIASNAEPCKHIWAAALAAQEQGFLRYDGGPIYGLQLDLENDPMADADEGAVEDDGNEDEPDARASGLRLVPPSAGPGKEDAPPSWKELRAWRQEDPEQTRVWSPLGPEDEIVYTFDADQTLRSGGLVLTAGVLRDGRLLRIPSGIDAFPDHQDRLIMALLRGAHVTWGNRNEPVRGAWKIPRSLREILFPRLCRTGRFYLKLASSGESLGPVGWDEGGPWDFCLDVARRADGGCSVTGSLRRGEERCPLEAPRFLDERVVFFDDRMSLLNEGGAFDWIAALRRTPEIVVGPSEVADFLATLTSPLWSVRYELPEDLRLPQVQGVARPRLSMSAPEEEVHGATLLTAAVSFDYEGLIVPDDTRSRHLVDMTRRRIVVRDLAAEAVFRRKLEELSFRRRSLAPHAGFVWCLPAGRLPAAVRVLVQDRWQVEAEGRLYRASTGWKGGVISGVDWFELQGGVQFGDETIPLPEILAAVRRGDDFVRLGDGGVGLLPEEWLALYGAMNDFAGTREGPLRFRPNQALLLDALLAGLPGTAFDDGFTRARERLQRFRAPVPAEASPRFAGRLRGYQKEGLGWMLFLREMGFGGCLADDMGLGKTVQVLAMLDRRRRERGRRRGVSLIVAPRSLVFNWKDEAARFTPGLVLRDHVGPERARDPDALSPDGVVITTYGTLRRDIAWLKDVPFDYAILDEAQAVKNAASQTWKAVRLLRADHRLALSGTPVENHPGELWSLFEFLNPGLLGASSVLRKLSRAGAAATPTTDLIARAVQPFILRRTKAQVAPELPERVEQTLYCDLEGAQKSAYAEMKDHYSRILGRRLERDGLARSKVYVLEALLRLRQAACHPGLIDVGRIGEPCAKLDALLPRLEQVVEEGHKALVFSQFTSFLDILRRRLDALGLAYAYLDGATRDRRSVVQRVQEDGGPGHFLISLKAGGQGLNLTAAEYVFLLDPWWNPAVEAQAIDRAHRIGQRRRVVAYRLVARDTVEEKILELQRVKRDLADSIIRADAGLLRRLTREDLELLLS